MTGDFLLSKKQDARRGWLGRLWAPLLTMNAMNTENAIFMGAPLKKAVFFNSLSVQKSGQQTKTELYLRLHLYFKSIKIILVRHFIRVKR